MTTHINLGNLRFAAKAHRAAASELKSFLKKRFGYLKLGDLFSEDDIAALESMAAWQDAEADRIFERARKAEEKLLAGETT